jgi:hypothetical protein
VQFCGWLLLLSSVCLFGPFHLIYVVHKALNAWRTWGHIIAHANPKPELSNKTAPEMVPSFGMKPINAGFVANARMGEGAPDTGFKHYKWSSHIHTVSGSIEHRYFCPLDR